MSSRTIERRAAARGFFVVGEATLSPQKSVRYLTRRLRLTPAQAARA